MIGLVVAPVTAAPAATPSAMPAVVRATLANGMRIVLLPDRLAPVATTLIEYHVGSNQDTIPGIAHATEHMLFRGTSDVSAAQFADIAARAGAQYDAQTANVDTIYYFTLPAAYVDIALRLEADRMTKALITQSDWNKERGAIEQEVRAHESNPVSTLMPRIRRALYGDTPYAHDPVGTIAGFERMTAADIAAFYRAWYHPNDATLIVAGDIDPAQTLAAVHQFFDPIPPVPLPPVTPIVAPTPAAQTIDGGIAELPVPVVAFDYRFPSLLDPQYAASQVLMTALDDQRSALHDLVVQGKALAAIGVASSLPDTGIGALLAVGLPTSSTGSLEASLQGVLDAYRASGVPDDLIAAAKRQILSGQSYREASIPGLAFSWGAALEEGQESPDDLYQTVASVSDRDVDGVLDHFVRTAPRVTIVLRPQPTTAVPRYDASAASENVAYPLDREPPLPDWAKPYFLAPLHAPQRASSMVVRLNNGLRVAIARETSSPVVLVEGSVRMNTDLNEPSGKDGVASLTDALMGWGTRSYDRVAYQTQLDAIAANVDLGSSFSLRVQSKNFDRGMELLADGMLHPAFPPPAFALLKHTTAQTYAASAKEPATIVALARLYALYPPRDPHRRHATAQTISRITLADVRKWYAFAFRPDLTTIAIVGDVTPERAIAAVTHYFGGWTQSGRAPNFVYPRIRRPHERPVSVTVRSPANRQSDVTLTQVLSIHRHDPQATALELADTILSGESTASLLYQRVRAESGYVYSIDSDLSLRNSSSTFTVTFASDPRNVGKAQAAAMSVIERMRTEPLPAAELQRAKALLLSQRVLPLDSYGGLAGDLLVDAADGWTQTDDTAYWERLLSVTPQQLRDAMRRWIDPRRFSRVILAPASP